MDTALVNVLVGSGGAAAALGAMVILFVTGRIFPKSVVDDKDRIIAELRADRDAQRQRADTAVAANVSTRDVLASFREGLEMGRRGELPPGAPERAGT